MRRSSGPAIAVIVLALLCLPVLYVLSIAPARSMVQEGWMPQDVYLTIYQPLLSAPGVGDWARNYARWWTFPDDIQP